MEIWFTIALIAVVFLTRGRTNSLKDNFIVQTLILAALVAILVYNALNFDDHLYWYLKVAIVLFALALGVPKYLTKLKNE